MATVSIDKIDVDQNVRTIEGVALPDDMDKLSKEMKEGIVSLAGSIKDVGLIQPVVLKAGAKGRFRLVVGWRRLMAHRYLKRSQILATMMKGKVEDETIVQLVENIHREDLEPLAIGQALKAIMANKKCTQAALAKLCRKSAGWVSQHLGLLEMAPEVKEAVKDGELSIGGARALATMPKDEQSKALESARKEAEEEAEEAAKKGKKKPGSKKKTPTSKSKSGKAKIKDKGGRRQARKKPGKAAGKTRPLADRVSEQKTELVKAFLDVTFGQTAPSKPQVEVVEQFFDYLHEQKRLVIK